MNPLSRQLRHIFCGYHLAAALLLLPALLLLSACGDAEAPDAAVEAAEAADEDGRIAIPVEVVVVSPGSFEDTISMTGAVEAPDDATLSAESAGTLTYLAPLGARVGRGAAVARIDAGLASAQVQQAEATAQAARAQLDLARDQFERQEPLYADSIISALEFQGVRTQLASAQAQVAQAEAQVAQAREGLSRTRIVAPFTGTVEQHVAERGEQVAPGLPVVRLVAAGRVKVRAGVPERYAADIEQGTPVLVAAESYGMEPARGTVTFVGAAIDPQSRTFPIEVALPDGSRLKPEMVVSLEVSRDVLDDVIALPLSALVRDERGTSVYVVEGSDGSGTVVRRPVEVGATSGGRAVVAGGLAAGDRVIVTGQTTVTEGDRVRVVESTSNAASLASFSE